MARSRARVRISRAYIDQYSRRIESVNKAAGKAVITESSKRAWAERMAEDRDFDFEEVARVMAGLCGTYSKLASALTCDFYNGIRDASVLADGFSAALWDGYDSDRIRAAAYEIAKGVASGNSTVPLDNLLENLTNREVKLAADETIRFNTKRDPKGEKYVIVPSAGACAFCLMRAANGYTYADEEAAESHDHCSCVATPVFGNAQIEGYDSNEYRDKYDSAKEALAKGDISDELKGRLESGNYSETSAILAVMREQNGIS